MINITGIREVSPNKNKPTIFEMYREKSNNAAIIYKKIKSILEKNPVCLDNSGNHLYEFHINDDGCKKIVNVTYLVGKSECYISLSEHKISFIGDDEGVVKATL